MSSPDPWAPRRAPLDRLPAGLHAAQDYEALAPDFIGPATLAHIAGGSGADTTLAANRAALAAWAILPRLLVDLRHGHTRLQLDGLPERPADGRTGGRTGGLPLAHPLLLAPVAQLQRLHPQAELAMARGAAAADALMLCSTLSSCTLEQVAQASAAPQWFQLYLQPQPEATLALVRRAEAAGYQALVLTLDTPVQAPSQRALRAGPAPAAHQQFANLHFANVPFANLDLANQHRANLPLQPGQPVAPAQAALAAGACPVFQGAMQQAPRWADLDWLLAHSRLPVWVKGVLHPADAQALVARGVAGLVVSNHGGRSLDGAPASLAMLPAVRAAVGPACPLLFDSGLRSGSDVFKALALGADAVLLGRLPAYALAVAGALGVAHLLKLLREELALCMALAGCATLADIGPGCLQAVWPPPPDLAANPAPHPSASPAAAPGISSAAACTR